MASPAASACGVAARLARQTSLSLEPAHGVDNNGDGAERSGARYEYLRTPTRVQHIFERALEIERRGRAAQTAHNQDAPVRLDRAHQERRRAEYAEFPGRGNVSSDSKGRVSLEAPLEAC